MPSEGTEFNLTEKPQGFRTAIEELLRVRGLADPSEAIALSGKDPFYKTPFKVGETVSAVLTTIGVAANDLWELRHGRRQDLSVDVGHAAASLRTVDYTRKQKPDGQYAPVPPSDSMAQMLTVTQSWATKDGKWFLPHLNLPGLSKKVLSVLQCENTVEGVSSSVRRWNGEDLEQAIADAGACGGLIRTPAEWLVHPQGQYLSARPVIEIRKVREGAPKPLVDGTRPLDGIRSLDLTRILAGPIAGRTLGEHGADVLMVTAPHLPQVAEHVRDTSHGKRSCFLDFEVPEQAAVFRSLVQTADVVIDGYRPGALTLARRAKEGGSYEVNVSLCQSAMFIQRRGLLDAFDTAPGSITDAEVEKLYVRTDTPNHGKMLTLGPVLQMSETMPRWVRPAPNFGMDDSTWNTA